MTKWIKFIPSVELPKERVSIAYDTHDERGVRYAYGYFQFHNGTCSSFWKDGNEQPKAVKVDDIKYWMPIPSFDFMQEEPSIPDIVDEHFWEMLGEETVSEDLEKAAVEAFKQIVDSDKNSFLEIFKAGAKWQKEQDKQWLAEEHKNIFAKGRDSMKQQMMKDAIKMEAHPSYGELWRSRDSTGCKNGDKVKVIIVKEE